MYPELCILTASREKQAKGSLIYTSSAVITLLVSPPSSCLSVRKRTPAVGSLLSCGSLLMS